MLTGDSASNRAQAAQPGNAMKFSALMSVYAKESPEFLLQSLASLAGQTVRADELVVVKDGPLSPDLEQVLCQYAEELKLVTVALPQNAGLGRALSIGLEHCSFEVVARVDSDDVYPPFRFARQIEFIAAHPEVSVVSAAGAEFVDDHHAQHSIRSRPGWVTLDRAARLRNPVSFHTTVMFRKQDVKASGSYQTCMGFEDYYLWARMLLAGFRIYNMPDVLAYVRCGNGMLSKRSGAKYIGYEIAFLSKCYQIGFLSKSELIVSVASRVPLRLLPAGMLGPVYRAFLRKPVPAPNGNSLE